MTRNYLDLIRYINKYLYARGVKRRRRLRSKFYLKNKEISRLREVISNNDIIEYRRGYDLDIVIYDDYLNNIDL